MNGQQQKDERARGYAKRKAIIERDGGQCVVCGAEHELQVHHMLALYKGGTSDDDNLITVCKSCHQKAPEDGAELFKEYQENPGDYIWKSMMKREHINTQVKMAFYEYIRDRTEEWRNRGYIDDETKRNILRVEAMILDEELNSLIG